MPTNNPRLEHIGMKIENGQPLTGEEWKEYFVIRATEAYDLAHPKARLAAWHNQAWTDRERFIREVTERMAQCAQSVVTVIDTKE